VRKVVPVSASKAGDCLQKEQLKIWFSAVRSLNNPIASAYLQVLCSPVHGEEIASLRWSDVDFKWSSMRIKDKIEGERIIPLTPYVSELLSALAQFPNSDVNKEGWVFRSNSKSGKIIEPRSGHNRALARAELPHISLHGLRRSFGTLLNGLKCQQVLLLKLWDTNQVHWRKTLPPSSVRSVAQMA
jgi:integrase